MKSGAGSFVRAFDAGYPVALSCQPRDPSVPVEGDSSRFEALPVDRFHQSIAAPRIFMKARGGIAGGPPKTAELHAERGHPIVDVAPRTVDVDADRSEE